MVTKDEALKFAVKALLPLIKRASPYGEDDWLDGKEAIEKCNAALAQPAQEPVANQCKGIPRKGCNYLTACDRVCNKCGEIHHHHQMVANFTFPPQRPWVGLTNNDWNSTAYDTEFRAGAEWAEDKLKEKNS